MSRGTEIIETVSVTGSREATIIVSVEAVSRPGSESMPIRRIVIRCGPVVGDGRAEGGSESDGSGVAKSLGSGATEPVGFQAPGGTVSPTKTSSVAIRASFVT